MRKCKDAAICAYGCWHIKGMCGLNDDDICRRDAEDSTVKTYFENTGDDNNE